MTLTLKVYVALKDEGTDCWRSVDAVKKKDGVFQIISVPPEDEAWEFPSGSQVKCKRQRLQDGEALVAYERID